MPVSSQSENALLIRLRQIRTNDYLGILRISLRINPRSAE